MRHGRDKHKAVFCLLWLEKVRTNRTYLLKFQYSKHSSGYCVLLHYK